MNEDCGERKKNQEGRKERKKKERDTSLRAIVNQQRKATQAETERDPVRKLSEIDTVKREVGG